MSSPDPTTHEPQRHHGGLLPTAPAPPDSQRASPTSPLPALDLSTCVDAFGSLEPVRQALRHVEQTQAYRCYPDPQSRRARETVARVVGVAPDCIDVAPGAAEAIWTLVRALTGPGDRAVVDAPCFSEFEHAARAHGVSVSSAPQLSVRRFELTTTLDAATRLECLSDAVSQARPKLVYLCAPSCPRGEWIPAAELQRLVAKHPAVHFVIDQSYLGMSAHAAERFARFPENAILLRSVTKELGLPGVRVGYALLAPALRERLQAHRPCWPLGAHAQAVLEVYDACQPALEQRRSLLLLRARELASALSLLGLRAELRDTHYLTIDLGVGPRAAPPRETPSSQVGRGAEFTRWLWREAHIAVRDCASFGLPDHVRVVAHPEQERLVAACSRWQAE